MFQKFIQRTERTYPYGKIATFTVKPTDEKGNFSRKGLDDYTYLHNPELIELVPRGYSVLTWNDGTTEELKGLPKFDGTTNLDEDENTSLIPSDFFDTWKNVQTSFQEKANGKMAIFKIIVKDGIEYIFGGSKNVHIVHELSKPVPDKPDLHYRILRLIQNDLQSCPRNVTIVGEYEDGCHIVYRESPRMVYFSCLNPQPKELLPTVNRFPTVEELDTLRRIENSEGCVIVYKNLETGEVKRKKHKTIWYIMIRVIREALSHSTKENDPNVLLTKVMNRFDQRSKDFLRLKDEELNIWKDRAYRFIQFMFNSTYQFADLRFDSSIGMARVWHSFVNGQDDKKENHLYWLTKDKYPVKTVLGITDLTDETDVIQYVENLIKHEIPVSLALRGSSGSGKSTLAKLLADKYNGEIFCTDDYFVRDGNYQFNPKMLGINHSKNLEAWKNCKKLLAIVDNTNLTTSEYNKYTGNRVLVVLNLKKVSPSVLATRTMHNVPFDSIVKMDAKFKPVYPSYYGVFFPRSIHNHTQVTPLHLTYRYVGRKEDDLELRSKIGREVSFSITGLKMCPAGQALVGTILDKDIPYKNTSDPHITLSTNAGHQPNEVGAMPADKILPEEKVITGVFGFYS